MDYQPSKRQKLNQWRVDDDSHDSSTLSLTGISKHPSHRQMEGSRLLHSNASRTSQHEAVPSLDRSSHPDLFKLQLQELLGTLRPKYETRMARVEKEVHRLRQVIELIPDREGRPALEAQRLFEQSNSVRIPFPNPIPIGSKVSLAYSKPANISIVGSYARKTALLLDSKVTIDMAVTMPSHLFQANDYHDHRYFHKRAFFLACLAAGIQTADSRGLKLLFAYQDDNPLQPIIIIHPSLGGNNVSGRHPAWRIRILLAARGDTFPLEKTLPTKRCTRNHAVDTQGNLPTPIYNATLRSECCSSSFSEQLRQTSVRSSAFQDACMLGAVWLRQRGLGSSMSAGGFGQFEWATVISVLLRDGGRADSPLLATGYNTYQLVKATLQFLSTTDLRSSPMFINSSSFKPTDSAYPIFFDGPRGLNILFKMTRWSYELLRNEAQNSLKALKDPLVDHFKILFVNKVNEPSRMFDHFIRVSVNSVNHGTSGIETLPGQSSVLADSLYEKFCYGLGNRARLIYPQISSTQPWQLDSAPALSSGLIELSVGFLLDPDHCQRTVDRGPSIEDKSASAFFRRFWGEKAELRRFRDGTILESLVWNNLGPKRTIVDSIVSHVLNHHFQQYEQDSNIVCAEAFDRLLPQQGSTQPYMLSPFSATMSSYEHLSKSIRAMEGLPLQIRQIYATSPSLRYSSLYGSLADRHNLSERPIDFLIQFEGSPRWPEDFFAVQRTKIAFLSKVAESLDNDDLVAAIRLRMEEAPHELLENCCLDIKTTDGFIFRLQIYHERELGMLEQSLKGRVPCAAPREQIALAISEHRRRFVQRPLHTQAVNTLSTRYPLLSLTMRLLKKWRDAHLLSPHLADEFVELIAVRTFVCPYPWQVPGSLNSAFLRTLAFVAGWNWQSEPLIIDFSSEMDRQDVEATHTRFEVWRKLDPGMNRMAVFAASNIDPEGITWTDRCPAKIVASRFTNLAKAACELVREQGLKLKLEALFVPSLAEYDFIIHLKPNHHTRRSSFKNLQVDSAEDSFEAAINCSQSYIDELKILYGDNIVFFYNECTLSVIAGLWNPQAGPRNWKVGLDYSTRPLGGEQCAEQQVTINVESILHDIARLGGDLVTRVDQKPGRHGDGQSSCSRGGQNSR